jgi:hypothetical protein
MPARRAEASWKAARAVELVREGKTYDQVARAVGYANRGTAHRVVTKALAERLVDGIDDLRSIEVARLDALQAALWPRVEKGEVRAINSVLRLIDRRCRLYGLYSGEQQESAWTLVMPPAEGNTGAATDVADDPVPADQAPPADRAA